MRKLLVLLLGLVTVLGSLTVSATTRPAAATTASASTAAASTAALPAAQAGTYRTVPQLRVLDSRSGIGGPAKALAPGEIRTVQVAGRGSLPSTGLAAVAVNVGVLAPSRSGSITVFPGGTGWTGVGSISFRAGVTVQSSLTAKLGANGSLAVRNNTGVALQLIADVAGYYLAGTATVPGAFGALTLARVLDTRSGIGGPATALAPGQVRTLAITGHVGVPAAGVAAVAVNVGVLAPARSGSVAVFAGNTTWNGTGSISFAAGGTVQSSLTAKLGANGSLAVRNNTAVPLQLVTDVAGYYLAGPPTATGGYQAIASTRVLDTRAFHTSIGPGETRVVPASPVLGADASPVVPPSGVLAVAANVGVLNPAAAGSVSVYPGNTAWNRTGSLSFPAGVTVQSSLTSTLGVDGTLVIRNNTSAALTVIVDLAGYYFGRPAPVSFGPPEYVDPTHGGVLSVSCGSATSCIAIEASGYVLSYGEQGWSAPRKVFTGVFSSVSCASATFCMAVGRSRTGEGVAYTFDGATWSDPAPLTVQRAAVSCTSATFCMAVDYYKGGTQRYDGTSWSAPSPVPGIVGTTSISCLGPTFCAMLDSEADSAIFDGVSWSVIAAPTTSDTGSVARRYVSCATPTRCVGVGTGAAISYDGTRWSSPVQIDTGRLLQGVSCPSADWCVAVDRDGRAMTLDGQSWSAPAPITQTPPRLASVSCASRTSCVVTLNDTFARASRYDGTSWSAPVLIDSMHGFPIAVSCTSQDFCMLLDRWGGARRYTAAGWDAWTDADPGVEVTALSCGGPASCVAVDTVGRVVGYTAGGWGQPTVIDAGRRLTSVSCVAPGSCVAVDSEGFAVTYRDGSWAQPVRIDASGLRRVSCAGPQFCAAADDQGRVLTWSGTGWSQPTGTPVGNVLGLSCASPSYCLLTGDYVTLTGSHTVEYDGHSWSPVPTNPYQTLSTVSCPAVAACVGVDAQFPALALGFDGTSWSAAVPVGEGMVGILGLSCVPDGFCMAVDYQGNASRTTA